MNHVAGGSKGAFHVLFETGSRHMSVIAPASGHRIDGRTTGSGSYHMSRIAPGSSRRLLSTLQGLLAHERMRRWHRWRASAELESTR
jgi:hypothetical protein